VSRRALLWLVPLFITVHNLEEMAFMPVFMAGWPDKVPGWATALLPAGFFPPSYHQFLVILLVVTILPYAFALLGGSRQARAPRTILLAGTQMVMLINVLSHVVSMNVVNGYVPGLVTALAINLPFSVYFFAAALHESWLRWSDFAYLVSVAVILHGPGFFGLMFLTK
jgi:hypothetical protein